MCWSPRGEPIISNQSVFYIYIISTYMCSLFYEYYEYTV